MDTVIISEDWTAQSGSFDEWKIDQRIQFTNWKLFEL